MVLHQSIKKKQGAEMKKKKREERFDSVPRIRVKQRA
jgi:hypothetical protein